MSEQDKKTLSIHSKDLGKNRWEVNGVIMYAPTHVEAIKKYLRKQKPVEQLDFSQS